ncbi:MAG: methyltransferase domain-containing protein [Proteobacteria bacterium]|nr:methyltransferase domain-containing protein [Pseudomonadota bacterium]
MNNQHNRPPAVFDRRLLRRRRDRAAQNIRQFDFLLTEVAERLIERLDVVKRNFPLIVDLGGAYGGLAERLQQRIGTEHVICMDTSFDMTRQTTTPAVVADEEFLPFRSCSLDAVISNLTLHWVNDLPGALVQIKQALKPDGLFLAALLGGESLRELRQCLMEAEMAVSGGASPRVSPFIDPRDMGALMQRAGFALPVIDSDTITVHYSSLLKLMQDLRGMGASNATYNRLLQPTRRQVILEATRLYQEKFADADGKIPATFQVVYAIGWAPHMSQPKPLRPGTAQHRLADALKTVENPAGEKAGH